MDNRRLQDLDIQTDKLGRFIAGNTRGIDSPERARELQKLSVARRKENKKVKMLRALGLVYAEENGWDALEKMLYSVAVEAYAGNIQACIFIMGLLADE
jgi:hypothetical protein